MLVVYLINAILLLICAFAYGYWCGWSNATKADAEFDKKMKAFDSVLADMKRQIDQREHSL